MSGTSQEEAIAARRFMIMGGLRISSFVVVILGLGMARQVVDGPYWLGVALSVIGLLGFFFGPPVLAKRWKAGDRARGGE